jgi:hypothetical protein
MRWIDITPERRRVIVEAAAARLATADDEADQPLTAQYVTVADLADYARGRPLRQAGATLAAIRMALRTDAAFREAFDRLFDQYAKVSIPFAAAASSGTVSKRRQADLGAEIEWFDSSVEPNTMFVRVHAPEWMRPVKELVIRGEDGDMRTIALVDDGDEIEVLVDRNSLEFSLLVNESSKLWLR